MPVCPRNHLSPMTGPAMQSDVRSAGGSVLFTLALAQFLMALDSSVMNVSIATVAKDLGTTVTGIQVAITLYTLVMAAFMITGGKIGQILGRKRTFMIGCVVYGCGSLMTALSPTLPFLLLGWSVLEGLGAALILPAVVALVATNFGPADRPRAYGLVMSAAAIAVAAGPLIGGLFTTYASWRWVFAGEVLLVLVIVAMSRRMVDSPPQAGVRLDLIGTVLSAAGLGMVVFGIVRAGTWGFVQPKPEAPQWLGASPVIWLILGGAVVITGFILWESRRLQTGKGVLIDPHMLRVRGLQAGLISFFFQYLLQAGLFFVIPLFLSVALGLSAVATGVRLLPLSISILVAAAGVPRLFPAAPGRARRLRPAGRGNHHPRCGTRRRCRARGGDMAARARRARRWQPGLSIGKCHRIVGADFAKRRRGWGPEHGDVPRGLGRHCPLGHDLDRRIDHDVFGERRQRSGGTAGNVRAGPGAALVRYPVRKRC